MRESHLTRKCAAQFFFFIIIATIIMAPKPLPTASAFNSVIGTRSSNKNTHPGLKHTKYDVKKRSTADVQAERARMDEEKREKKQQSDMSIAHVAEIEDRQRREDAKRKVGDKPSKDGPTPFRPAQSPRPIEATSALEEAGASEEIPDARKSNNLS